MQRAIIDGEKVTGVTIMYMAEGLDTGDMLYKSEVEIAEDDNFESIHDKLSVCGADALIETVKLIKNGEAKREVQNDALSTYAAKIEKSESLLNFNNDATYIERKIRAFNPYPATYFEHNGERFKLLKCKVVTNDKNLPAGKFWHDKTKMIIGCNKDALEVIQIQRQGKKAMSIQELLRGYSFL
jgi:methionyl-tRNA formyltransferase